MLTFDKSNHIYHWNGKQLPSVTEILEKTGWIDKTWFTDDARNRGTATHEAIRLYLQDDLDPDSVHPEVQPRLDAAKQFLHDMKVEPIHIEVPMACILTPGQPYAGTPDLVCKMDGAITVIDWKNAAVESCWWPMQMKMYSRLDEIKKLKDARLHSVRLLEDGTYRMSKNYRDDLWAGLRVDNAIWEYVERLSEGLVKLKESNAGGEA